MDWEEAFYQVRVVAMTLFALVAIGSGMFAWFTAGWITAVLITVCASACVLWLVCFMAYDPSNKDD